MIIIQLFYSFQVMAENQDGWQHIQVEDNTNLVVFDSCLYH